MHVTATQRFTAYGPSHWAVLAVFLFGAALLVVVGRRHRRTPAARHVSRGPPRKPRLRRRPARTPARRAHLHPAVHRMDTRRQRAPTPVRPRSLRRRIRAVEPRPLGLCPHLLLVPVTVHTGAHLPRLRR